VFGHKPTYGVVSYKGHQRGGVGLGDITVVGPLARGAEDLEIAMEESMMEIVPQLALASVSPSAGV